MARTADASWYQLAGSAWIAAFLVDNAPSDVPLATDIPVLPTSTPVPTPQPAAESVAKALPTLAAVSDSHVGIGGILKGNGWEFRVVEAHKRKAVYWGNDSRVAFGYYLVLIIEMYNAQSGTDYFYRNLEPYIVEDIAKPRIFQLDRSATVYATWQFGGLGTYASDVNPGVWGKLVAVYDLPADVGEVSLSTSIPAWVHLGDFGVLPIEE